MNNTDIETISTNTGTIQRRTKDVVKYVRCNHAQAVAVLEILAIEFLRKVHGVKLFPEYKGWKYNDQSKDFQIKQERCIKELVDIRNNEDLLKYANELWIKLAHLIKLGVSHRDISPFNIMIDKDDHVCFIDPGWFTIINNDSGCRCGTPGYLDIAKWEDIDTCTYSSDIWAVAMSIVSVYSQNVVMNGLAGSNHTKWYNNCVSKFGDFGANVRDWYIANLPQVMPFLEHMHESSDSWGKHADLIESILIMDRIDRISVEQFLEHPLAIDPAENTASTTCAWEIIPRVTETRLNRITKLRIRGLTKFWAIVIYDILSWTGEMGTWENEGIVKFAQILANQFSGIGSFSKYRHLLFVIRHIYNITATPLWKHLSDNKFSVDVVDSAIEFMLENENCYWEISSNGPRFDFEPISNESASASGGGCSGGCSDECQDDYPIQSDLIVTLIGES